jgi:UDP-N-acetylglucosamine 1-carboxyvinyltransferase
MRPNRRAAETEPAPRAKPSIFLSDTRRAPERPDVLVLEGGVPLQGTVEVRGAKNSVPKQMVASVLTNDPCELANVPDIQDVEVVADMLGTLGAEIDATSSNGLKLNASGMQPADLHRLKLYSGKSRIPILLCGPLLHRFGVAVFPVLGGCRIGKRPVDYHIELLRELGAEIEELPDSVRLTAKKLRGNRVRLEYPSVGATEQLLLAAVLAEGVTELSNAAIEPEIIDLICVLQKMGAVISVDADRVIRVVGCDELHGFEHTAIPDRLEASSWACAAAATNGRIFVKNARQQDMMTFLNAYRQMGGDFHISDEGIEFWRSEGGLRAISLETDVHPGFMTDWLPPFAITLSQAEGVSIAHETVYENRFGYVDALNKMGAKIQLHRECLGSKNCRFGQRNFLHSAVISGPTQLHAADVEVPDLRGGFSYVIAALAANGVSRVGNASLIRRGYEGFVSKLHAVGAAVVKPL